MPVQDHILGVSGLNKQYSNWDMCKFRDTENTENLLLFSHNAEWEKNEVY